MTRLVVLATLSCVAAGLVASASPADQAGQAGARWGQRLGLSDEQKAAIRSIITDAVTKAGAAPNTQAKVVIFKDARDKIKALLNPDQLQKIQAFRQNHPGLWARIRERIRDRIRHDQAGAAGKAPAAAE